MLSLKFIIILSIAITSLLIMTSDINQTHKENNLDVDKDLSKDESKNIQQKQQIAPPSVKIDRAKVIQFLEQERREKPQETQITYFTSNPEIIHAQMLDVLNKEFNHIDTQNAKSNETDILPINKPNSGCTFCSLRN